MNGIRDTRKTVGVFMTFLSGIRGGADVTVMWLIQALCTQYNVTLVTTSRFDFDFFNRFASTQLRPDQFQVRRIPLLPTPQAFPMSALQEAIFQRAARDCAAEFDICVSAMGPIDLGVPAVDFIADFEVLLRTDKASQPGAAKTHRHGGSLPRQIYHWLSARIQNPSGRDPLRDDVLVSNSGWVAATLAAMGIDSPVIYPPVPYLSSESDWHARRADFVWFGRIAPQKKVEEAINIVAGLRSAGFDCSIHIAGTAVDKGYLRRIKDLAKELGDWVVLRGPVYGADKAALLNEFRYALHTRADEPFGITLVELIKTGCIPFAPNSCGSAEILNHPAVLYSNEGEAVAKIKEVISDPTLCQSVRTFLKHRADYFSTENFCASALSLTSNFLGGKQFKSNTGPVNNHEI
jgi:glycosyltransferase involved in cell wall biosynthesis